MQIAGPVVPVADCLLNFLFSVRDVAVSDAAVEHAISVVRETLAPSGDDGAPVVMAVAGEKVMRAVMRCFDPGDDGSTDSRRSSRAKKDAKTALANAVGLQGLQALLRAMLSLVVVAKAHRDQPPPLRRHATACASSQTPSVLTTMRAEPDPLGWSRSSHQKNAGAGGCSAAMPTTVPFTDNGFARSTERILHPLGGRRTTINPASNFSNLHGHQHMSQGDKRDAGLQQATQRQDVVFGLSMEPSRPVFETTGTALYEVNGIDGSVAINQYTFLDCIGHGAQGEVHLAFDNYAGEFRAIKVLQRPPATSLHGAVDSIATLGGISPRTTSAPAMSKQSMTAIHIAQELRIMRGLRHPHIVKLYEVVDDPTRPEMYMVMQYAQHGPLATVGRDGSCSIKVEPVRLARLGQQLCSALSYLHRRGVVHRDVKPENILLGNDDQVYLADFGSAELLSAPSPSHAATTHRRGFRGTIAFLAPELLQHGAAGDGAAAASEKATEAPASSSEPGLPVTAAIDVWALGVTLYTLLYGTLPFRGATMNETMEAIMYASLDLDDVRGVPGCPRLDLQHSHCGRTSDSYPTAQLPDFETDGSDTARFSGSTELARTATMHVTLSNIFGTASVAPDSGAAAGDTGSSTFTPGTLQEATDSCSKHRERLEHARSFAAFSGATDDSAVHDFESISFSLDEAHVVAPPPAAVPPSPSGLYARRPTRAPSGNALVNDMTGSTIRTTLTTPTAAAFDDTVKPPPDIWGCWRHLLFRMLDRSPTQRPSSDDVLEALQRLLVAHDAEEDYGALATAIGV